MLILNFLLLFLGIAILIFGATVLVDASSSLAKKFNIPSIVIGLTIVSIGTSAPELVVNLLASSKGNSGIVLGNVVGSNILNILVILGITSIIYPLTIKKKTTTNEIPLGILSSILLFVTANDMFFNKESQNVISLSEGIVYILFFIIFMAYIFDLAKNSSEEEELEVKNWSKTLCILFIIVGAVCLAFGGNIILENSTVIAQALGVPERIIGLTIISMGTSLPELATSIIAALKKNVDIAVGNVVGSNIFNVFLVLGLSSIVNPVAIDNTTVNLFNLNFSSVNIDLVVNILSGVFLFLFAFVGKKQHKIERKEGIFFISFYLAYLVYLITSVK